MFDIIIKYENETANQQPLLFLFYLVYQSGRFWFVERKYQIKYKNISQ